MEKFVEIITILYATVGLISIIAFWPTIKDLWNKKPSANSTSVEIWIIVAIISCLYGLFIIHDFLFTAISGVNLGLNMLVLSLRLRIRRK